MESAILAGLQPGVREWAEYTVAVGRWYGLDVTVTSGYRSIERQAELYRNRATNPYPVARPGSSAHNWGLAWDSSVPEGQWQAWTQIREAIGWQVPRNDRVHAAIPDWRRYVNAA